MRIRIGLITSGLLTLAFATGAQAALPTTHNKLAVPFKSIAGVKLGTSLATATAAWGKGGTCTEMRCTYESSNPNEGAADFVLGANESGKIEVAQVSILAGPVDYSATPTATTKSFKTPLAKIKTSKGIHLGSTFTALKHAYPHLTQDGSTEHGSTYNSYLLIGKPESTTMLFELGPENRVIGISVENQFLS